MKNTHLTETRFSNLELSDRILTGLKEAGFKQCCDGVVVTTMKGKKQRLWIIRPDAKFDRMCGDAAGKYY